MSVVILTDCFIEIDDVEYSVDGTNVAIAMSRESQSLNRFGDGPWQVNWGAGISWTLEAEIVPEAHTGTFFAMINDPKPVPIRVRAVKADPVSDSNPEYVGQAVLTEVTPISGGFAEINKMSLSFVGSGELTIQTQVV
jgi:hypothetical protein